MMMKEPPVTPALPIPATARCDHMKDLALTAKSHEIKWRRLDVTDPDDQRLGRGRGGADNRSNLKE